MDQGFVKLWRKSIDSAVFQDANLWKLWTWCLIRANHKDVFVPIKTGRGQAVIELKRGQFIFGRRTAAKALKMKPSTIGYRLQILEKLQNLDRQVNHHFTIVTIRNYDLYNDIKNKVDQQVVYQLSTNCPPTDTDKNKEEDLNTPVETPKIPYKEIIEYLNLKAGKHYRYTTKETQEKIRARWNAGFTSFDNYKYVIDIKCAEWLNDPKNEQYLRPETLFGTKFEGYLNQRIIKNSQSSQTISEVMAADDGFQVLS